MFKSFFKNLNTPAPLWLIVLLGSMIAANAAAPILTGQTLGVGTPAPAATGEAQFLRSIGVGTPAPAATGAIAANGAIVGGSGTAPACTAGDGCFSRSTTTGALKLGGSSTNCVLDWGVLIASTASFNCNANVSGFLAVGIGTLACSSNYTCVESSASTGGLVLGGQTNHCLEDFGVTTSLQLTISCSSAVIGSLQVGNNANDTTSGDVNPARSTTSGELKLGGSSGQTIDYGVTTASKFTLSAPANVVGNFTYSTVAAACSSSSNLPCGGASVASCTESSGTCSTTYTVPSGAQCVVAVNDNSGITAGSVDVATVSIVTTTLTLHAYNQSAAATHIVRFNVICV